MLRAENIPNYVNGVSQQPYYMRLQSHLETCINGLPDPVEGLIKRPPTEHVAVLGAASANAFVHLAVRNEDQQNVIVVDDGEIRVWDIDGTAKTINGTADPGYLTSSDPASDIEAVTALDTTLIINKGVTVAADDSTASDDRPFEALIFVKQGNYGKTFRVFLEDMDTAITSYACPDGSSASHSAQIDATYIATQLKNGIVAGIAYYGYTNYTVEQRGSVIRISNTATDFDVRTEDGLSQNGLTHFKDKVQLFTDLPADAFPGFKIKIAGDANSDYDDYWVESGEGVWEETIAPDTLTSLDETTLPYELVRETDGTFTLSPVDWVTRQIGDLTSAPWPDFVGLTINDIGFYRNRLAILAGELVCLSQSGDYFNYFPTSVTVTLDSDPVFMTATANQESVLQHAIPFDRSLLLFAENSQFVLTSGQTLTPNTTSVDPTTEFKCSKDVRPVRAGPYVFFAYERAGQATALSEYFVNVSDNAASADANEVTKHTPTYIPANTRKIAVDTTHDILVIQTTNEPESLYVYKYLWAGSEKVQSAICKWTFDQGAKVLDAEFSAGILHLVIWRAGYLYKETMDLSSKRVDSGLAYLTLLDRRLTQDDVSMVYSGVADATTFTLPYGASNPKVVTGNNPEDIAAGVVIEHTQDGLDITVDGDWRTRTFFIGEVYEFEADLTKPVMQVPARERGLTPRPDVKLKVKDYTVRYADTGYFKATFTPEGRSAVETIFSPITLGASDVGVPQLKTGEFRIKTTTEAKYWNLKITSDSHFPVKLQNGQWRADAASKSR